MKALVVLVDQLVLLIPVVVVDLVDPMVLLVIILLIMQEMRVLMVVAEVEPELTERMMGTVEMVVKVV